MAGAWAAPSHAAVAAAATTTPSAAAAAASPLAATAAALRRDGMLGLLPDAALGAVLQFAADGGTLGALVRGCWG